MQLNKIYNKGLLNTNLLYILFFCEMNPSTLPKDHREPPKWCWLEKYNCTNVGNKATNQGIKGADCCCLQN